MISVMGNVIVIPFLLHTIIIEELEKNYPGVVRMKVSECSYFWWPFLDEIIGNSATQYNSCQVT